MDPSIVEFIADRSPGQLLFLCGSGVSQNAPTAIPTVARFLREVMASCDAEDHVRELVMERLTQRSVSPRFEVLIDEIQKTHDPTLRIARVFNSTKFNGIHSFLDQMLELGASVLTTNFDNCIENAASGKNRQYSRLVFSGNDLASLPQLQQTLIKVHGSNSRDLTDDSHLLITVRALAQTIGGFRRLPNWREYLSRLINDHFVVVFGYSGSDDFDITPLLLDASPFALLWFSYDPAVPLQFVDRSDVSGPLLKFSANPKVALAKGDLRQLVDLVRQRMGLVMNLCETNADGYSVVDYVDDIFPTICLREELLNLVLSHFSLFELVLNRRTMIESPLIDSQRIHSLYALGRYHEACRMYEGCKARFVLPHIRTQALFLYSASLYYCGKFDEALTAASDLLYQVRTEGDIENEVRILNHIGGIRFAMQRDQEASECYRAVLRIHEDSPISIESEGAASWGLGGIELRAGNPVSARPLFERALRIYESLGYEVRTAWIRHNLGETDLQERNYDQAIEVLAIAEKSFRELGNHSGLLYVINAEAKAFYKMLDWPAVDRTLAESLAIVDKHPEEPTAPEVLLLASLAFSGKREGADLDGLSERLFGRVLKGRAETPAVTLMKKTMAERFSPTAIRELEVYLFGE